MRNKLKLSVIMSTYNGSQYLVEQLDSIRMQTRQPDEVLIRDDCSTDDTVHLIRSYIDRYHLANWHLSENEVNQGWRTNFKIGMSEARGDILFPCDQDDIWHANKLELTEKIMMDHPNISVMASDYLSFRHEHKICEWEQSKIDRVPLEEQPLKSNFFCTTRPGCAMSIRNDLYHKIEPYWLNSFAHDAFVSRFAQLVDGYYLARIPLLDYRLHEDSSYSIERKNSKNKKSQMEWIDYSIHMIDKMKDFVQNNNIRENESKLKILSDARNWAEARQSMLQKPDIWKGLRLIPYFKYYPYKSWIISDWLISYKGR